MLLYIMIGLMAAACVCAVLLVRLYVVYSKRCQQAGRPVKWWARASVCVGLCALICVGVGSYVGLQGRQAEYQAAEEEYDLLAQAARGNQSSRDALENAARQQSSLINVANAEAAADSTNADDIYSTAYNASADSPYATGDEEFDMNDLEGIIESNASADIDFDYLRSVNPDVVAWISIPGTRIDYPVVQGADNDKYLKTTFTGKSNACGTIFLDATSPNGMDSQHVIIYGHNMKDGSMFTGLTRFKKQDFLNKYNTIKLYTTGGMRTLKVISVYQQARSEWPYITAFSNNDDYAAYVNDTLRRGGALGDYTAANINRLYTFTTCSYDAADMRLFITAVEE